MTYLGAHLSSSRGFFKMGQDALTIGANTFQCFVRNPRGARAKAVKPEDMAKLRALLAENQFGPFVAHAPYIMPSLASSFITSSTSPTISGSSAEVGSSNNMTSGSMARARTIATRCFCPPESWIG